VAFKPGPEMLLGGPWGLRGLWFRRGFLKVLGKKEK